jgi:hypothetical protein
MKSRATLIIVTAVISVVVTSALWLSGIVLAYRFFTDDPPPFAMVIDAPQEATVGETITLNLKVSNPTDERLQLGSVDVYDSLLDGFTLIKLNPEPNERDHTLDFSTFYYSKPLNPGESFAVSLDLKATQPGVWTGDVDFCTPSEEFVTSSVTIRVRAEQNDPANGSQLIGSETNSKPPNAGSRR